MTITSGPTPPPTPVPSTETAGLNPPPEEPARPPRLTDAYGRTLGPDGRAVGPDGQPLSMAELEGLNFTLRPLPDQATSPLVMDVRDLGVKYSLRFTRKTTLREAVAQRFRRDDRPTEFWALQHVTFKLVNGELLAVIGPNGAGKSTLLQVLAGIITPSEGSVDVRGAISSLLTLGAGFDQDLTGRDNIWLAGAFMGIPHREMAARIEPIVEFADIGPFIDAPIKTYSSGMRARLGFSIATSVDPDILLLDEVLATGDEVFRAKSKQRILDLVQSAKAIVLVTHDMNWVTEFCNNAMLLEQGGIVAAGAPADVVRIHVEHSREMRALKAAEVARFGGSVSAR